MEKKWKYGIDLGNSVFDFPSLIVLSTRVFHGMPHTKSFSECTLTKMALLVQTYLVHNSVSQNQTWGKRIMGEWGLMKVLSGWWENSIDRNKTKQMHSASGQWINVKQIDSVLLNTVLYVSKSNSVLEAIIKREPGKCELSASEKCECGVKETPTRCGLINSLETASIIMLFQVYMSLMEYQWQLAIEILSMLLTVYFWSSNCLPCWTQF